MNTLPLALVPRIPQSPAEILSLQKTLIKPAIAFAINKVIIDRFAGTSISISLKKLQEEVNLFVSPVKPNINVTIDHDDLKSIIYTYSRAGWEVIINSRGGSDDVDQDTMISFLPKSHK